MTEDENVDYIREFLSNGTYKDIFPSGIIHESTWSLEKDGITIHYTTATPPWVFKGKIIQISDTSLELELKMTQEGIDGYLNIIERYERIL